MMNTDIIVAMIALVASIVATIVTVVSQRDIKLLEEKLKKQQETAQFTADQLTHFYLPVAMHLATTKNLYNRFYEAGKEEKTAIEHELRIHNAKVRDYLMASSTYLEEDVPEGMLDELLEHLIQWEIVYKLKYEYKVYDGPVFAGIEQFGFRAFPKKDVDGYFKRKVKELKERYHRRFKENA